MTTSKATAAAKNITGHPNAGMSGIPASAAMEPPIGTPDIMSVAIVERHFAGTSSVTSAFAEGTRPPNPMPASIRRAPKTRALGENAHRMVKTENTRAQPMMVRRRPNMSDIRPAKMAPTIMPTNAMEPTVPAVAFVSPQPVSLMRDDWTVP